MPQVVSDKPIAIQSKRFVSVFLQAIRGEAPLSGQLQHDLASLGRALPHEHITRQSSKIYKSFRIDEGWRRLGISRDGIAHDIGEVDVTGGNELEFGLDGNAGNLDLAGALAQLLL